MQTSLSIKMKDTDNKDLQKSITYVSASASSADLREMAMGLVSLTTNDYVGSDRIQKINVDDETVPVVKPVPTLVVNDGGGGSTGTIAYSGNGSLVAYSSRGECTISGSNISAPTGTSNVSGIICASETADYASTWSTFTLTGGTT